MTTKFQIQTRYFGSGKDVVYDCPNCGHNLISPLDEAGITDFCPACNGTFVVPGEAARKREIQMAERKSIEAKRKAEDAAIDKQLKERSKKYERLRKPEAEPTTISNGQPTFVINNSATATATATGGDNVVVWLLIWFFFGLPFASFLCLTIIGIPFGIAMFVWFFIGLMKRM